MIKFNVNLMKPKIQNPTKLNETGKVSRALTEKEKEKGTIYCPAAFKDLALLNNFHRKRS